MVAKVIDSNLAFILWTGSTGYKLNFHNLFIVGEDDMGINSAHVNQYFKMQREIDRQRNEAQKGELLKGNMTRSNLLLYGN
jgi:hypothetical protein